MPSAHGGLGLTLVGVIPLDLQGEPKLLARLVGVDMSELKVQLFCSSQGVQVVLNYQQLLGAISAYAEQACQECSRRQFMGS